MNDPTVLTFAASADIPVFNEDVLQKQIPAGVADLRARIGKASAVLIVTPKYTPTRSRES